MSQSTWLRVGGAAAILDVVLMAGYYVLPPISTMGALAVAVFVLVLYRLFRESAPRLSLAGAVLGIGGSVILAAMWLTAGDRNAAPQNIATWAAFFAPPLLFGIAAYRYPNPGMSRILALTGIAGGVFGLINLIVVLIGGGNWSEPNNPALSPLIMATYYAGMLLTLVWMVWTGVVLLRRKALAISLICHSASFLTRSFPCQCPSTDQA
jgi:hypothetical protein